MKRAFLLFCIVGVVVIITSAVLLSAAPYLIDTFLIPRLEKENPGVSLSAKIQHITPWRLSGNIEIGQGAHHVLSIPHLELTYTPFALMRGRLSSLLVEGITLRLKLIDGRLILESPLPGSSKTPSKGPPIPAIALGIETLVFRNCYILIDRGKLPTCALVLNGRFDLDFVHLSHGGYALRSVKGHLNTQGALTCGLRLELQRKKQTNHVHFSCKTDRLADLRSFFPGVAKLSGNGTFDLAADFSGDFKTIEKVKATAAFPSLAWDFDSFHLKAQGSQPLRLELSGTNKLLHYKLFNLKTTGTHSIEASLSGDIDPARAAGTGSGQIRIRDLPDPLHLALTGSIHNRQTDLKLLLAGNRQEVSLGTSTILVIGPYQLTTLLHRESGITTIEEEANIETTQMPQNHLVLRNIRGRFPLVSNLSAKHNSTSGELSVGRINYQGEDLAKLQARLTPALDGLNVRGSLTGLLGAEPSFLFHGNISKLLTLTLSGKLPETRIDRDSLPLSLPLPAEATVSGTIGAMGFIKVTPAGTRGNLKIAIKDGDFELPKKKIHLIGINSRITFPHLPQPASDPSQVLTIDKLDVNDLKLTSGKILFRLEANGSLFLERSRFNWCHGRVESGALRLSDSAGGVSTTLYCDRLNFAELLGQLGITGVEGKGSLNGRLPVTLSPKGLNFDDGFLFSTPGNNGIVRFNNSEMLRQSIAGATQNAVLDYSIQAMRDFAYNWTKLTFNSQGGDLLVSMQIDGKPASPLPYGYSKGRLVSRKDGPGLQHPIRLDVNFHLPLAKMFQYSRSLQKLMEKIQ